MKSAIKYLLTAISVVALSARAQDSVISISKPTSRLIPVSISGFSGEVDSVLKFDLSVLGIVVSEPSEYSITGRSEGRVEGTLTETATHRSIFNRAYSGGSFRAQAHALANDIAKELRQTAPIFQSKIAFRVKVGAATEIAVSDYDGNNMIVITHDNTLVDSPTWERGGRGLLYTSWMNGDTHIYEHNLSTGIRRVFAGYSGSCFNPQVSPDGEKVAMILSKNGSPNLYVSDISGGNLRQLTRTRDDDSSPTWNPDSREICFVCRSGHAMLEKVSIDGGPATPVHVAGAYGNLTSPDWSPDGSQIAFTSGSRPFHIWVMPAGGGEAKLEVDGEDPCWAPNSRTIIFSQRMNDKQSLCLLDVPTKHVKTLRQISGSCSEPSWAR
jgi:TolB protein